MNNRTSTNTLPNTHHTTPLLICPYCNKNIPQLQFHYADELMHISLKCICSEEQKLLTVKDFLTQLNQNTSYHTDYSANHTQPQCQPQSEYEVYVKCNQHNNSLYSKYCTQCNVNLCNDCSISHEDHHLIDIPILDLHVKSEKTLEALIAKHRLIKDDFIGRIIVNINSDHSNYSDTKEKLKDFYTLANANQRINEELLLLYKSFAFTALTFKDYRLYQLIQLNDLFTINTNELAMRKDLSFEDAYKAISEYYLNNYLFIQINNNKKCQMTLYGHNHNIFCLIQLRNGLLASSSGDRTVRIWNIHTKKCEYTLIGHTHSVCFLTQLRDNRIVTGSYKVIKFWNGTTYQCEATLPEAHLHFVYCLFQIKDDRLVSASEDGLVKIWDINTLQCITVISDNTENINSILCVIELNDGGLAWTLFEGSIKVFNPKLTKAEIIGTQQSNYIKSIIQLKDNRLATGLCKSIKIWNLNNHQCEVALIGHSHFVFCLLEMDNGILASGSGDKTIKYWNIKTNQCIATLVGHSWYIYYIVKLTNGKLASGSYDNTVKIWDS